MTKDAALRLALEALEKVTKQMLAIRDELAERGGRPTNNFVHEELWDSSFDVYINCAIPTAEAIKAALEAKDEPVAWLRTSGTGSPVVTEALLIEMPEMRWNFQQPLYTNPPQRTWVGLTDEDLANCSGHEVRWALHWEKVLKEKNT